MARGVAVQVGLGKCLRECQSVAPVLCRGRDLPSFIVLMVVVVVVLREEYNLEAMEFAVDTREERGERESARPPGPVHLPPSPPLNAALILSLSYSHGKRQHRRNRGTGSSFHRRPVFALAGISASLAATLSAPHKSVSLFPYDGSPTCFDFVLSVGARQVLLLHLHHHQQQQQQH